MSLPGTQRGRGEASEVAALSEKEVMTTLLPLFIVEAKGKVHKYRVCRNGCVAESVSIIATRRYSWLVGSDDDWLEDWWSSLAYYVLVQKGLGRRHCWASYKTILPYASLISIVGQATSIFVPQRGGQCPSLKMVYGMDSCFRSSLSATFVVRLLEPKLPSISFYDWEEMLLN